MNFAAAAIGAAERLPLPDRLTLAGIERLVASTNRRMSDAVDADAAFARTMPDHPIALHTDAANAQHYELPPEFFGIALGRRRKYSCCLYPSASTTLDEAEQHALEETASHAALADGQDVLELGCGWGSLSLWMAEHYTGSRITAVSNSKPQRAHIEKEASRRGLSNLRVVTADMNVFAPDGDFDRVVSVEMFEHMSNWTGLLARIRTWLRPDGRLFLHVFSHHAAPYRFDHDDPADWIARHFFTGGIMPSHGLLRHVAAGFAIEDEWRWSGEHYRRTAMDWLARYDANAAAVRPILRGVYGDQAGLWFRRWRLFFLATAGLFGHDGGAAWGVSHYRLRQG